MACIAPPPSRIAEKTETVRMTKRSFKRFVAFLCLLPVFLKLVASNIALSRSGPDEVDQPHQRHLLSSWLLGDECITEFELAGNGAPAAIVYIIAIAYNFLALAVVVDGYFVRSIEVILEKLQVSEDLAGAIFMAGGTSAAELFSNTIDTFLYRSNIGFGVIYGTVLFNIFVGIGYAAFVCPSDVKKVDWRALSRDTIWYIVSIVFVVGFIWDQEVHWYESLILVLLYMGYVLCVVFQRDIENLLCPLKDGVPFVDREGGSPKSGNQNVMELDDQSERNEQPSQRENKSQGDTGMKVDMNKSQGDTEMKVDMKVDKVGPGGEDVSGSDIDAPEGACTTALKVLYCPINFIFYWTIPDSGTKEKPTGKYMFSFVVACLWIAVLSWLMVKLATSIGCLIGVGPVLLGTTFLAMGTSIPDCMSTIIAAKKGQGGMAVSNTLGSNIFDMQIAIGLPWLIFSAAFGKPYPLDHGSMAGPITFLLLSALVLHFGLSLFGWKLRKRLGAVLLTLYAAFLIYAFCEEFA